MSGFTWKRAVTEGAVVVASILMAFAIDAWWQEREDRDLEALAIAGIRSDFEGHLAMIDTSLEQNQLRWAASDSLLALVGPNAVATDPERIIRQMGLTGFLSTASFQGGSLATLANTSGLASIQNRDLRLALSEWLQALEFGEMVNGWAYDETERYSAALDDRIPLADLDLASGLVDVQPSGFAVEITPMLRSIQFTNRVYQQRYVSGVLIEHLTAMRGMAERVLDLSASR